MQITHLFIADLLWIAMVLLTAEVIAFGGRSLVADRRAETHTGSQVRG
jgi:hypothetical protein